MKNLIIILSALCLSISYVKSQAPPTIASYETKVLCPDGSSGPQIGISNIIFNSPGGQEIYITGVAPQSANFTLPTQINEVSGSQILFETVSGGATGPIDVTVYFNYIGGPTFSDIITINVATPPDLTITPVSICKGLDEYDLKAHAVTPGGQFIIYPPEFFVDNGVFNPKVFSEEFNFSSYSYEYILIDNYGCYYSSPTDENIVFSPSPKITIQNVDETDCNENEGEIKVSVNSPNGTYVGYWNNGVQTNNTISNLSAGVYKYSVEDVLGCTDNISAIVPTDGFNITGTISHVNCKGGSDGKISISFPNASGNHKIMWSSGHGSKDVTGLTAGTYLVHVKDLDTGCEAFKNFTVNEPLLDFEITTNSTPPTCNANDGSLVVSGFAGSATPYTFLWNTGATTSNLNGVPVGYYSVEVTDSKGCKATYSQDLNSSTTPYPLFEIMKPTCGKANGAIYINGFSHSIITPVSYSWSNGSTTRNVSDISAGLHTLVITYNDGCTSSHSYEVSNSTFNYSPEICIVTVDTVTNTNLVVWEKEVGNPYAIDYYKIYRENSTTEVYEHIGTVNNTNISVFNDVVVSPEKRSWKYKISAVNSCGQESYLSKRHKTIHLVMKDGPVAGSKKLTWDHYEGLDYIYYDLYRGTNIDGWQLIQGNISPSTLPDFNDVLPTGATDVEYIVEVIPTSGGCTATFNKVQDYNSSRSNKPSPIFDPGKGTGDPSNSVATYENGEFKALVYPNPSNGDFNIRIEDNINLENLNMTMMGVNGNIIHQQSLNNDLNTFQLNLDAGLYFIQIQGKSTLETIRVVIQ